MTTGMVIVLMLAVGVALTLSYISGFAKGSQSTMRMFVEEKLITRQQLEDLRTSLQARVAALRNKK